MCFGQLLSNRKILILCLNGNSHRKKTLFDLKISNDLFDGTFTVIHEPPSIFFQTFRSIMTIQTFLIGENVEFGQK